MMTTQRKWMVAVAVAGLVAGLTGSRAPMFAAQATEEKAIVDFFAEYDAAFVAKDLDRLARLYHPDVTIFEGGGTNTGWADYRDHHIGPELKSFDGLKFSHSNIKVQMIGPDAAYVTSEYAIETIGANGPMRSGGLETDVLVRQSGTWLIRHTHTSARRQRPGGEVND
jgi:uncharacterized protein (TIGR02246 family)